MLPPGPLPADLHVLDAKTSSLILEEILLLMAGVNGDDLGWSLVRYLTVQSMSALGQSVKCEPRSSLPAEDRDIDRGDRDEPRTALTWNDRLTASIVYSTPRLA